MGMQMGATWGGGGRPERTAESWANWLRGNRGGKEPAGQNCCWGSRLAKRSTRRVVEGVVAEGGGRASSAGCRAVQRDRKGQRPLRPGGGARVAAQGGAARQKTGGGGLLGGGPLPRRQRQASGHVHRAGRPVEGGPASGLLLPASLYPGSGRRWEGRGTTRPTPYASVLYAVINISSLLLGSRLYFRRVQGAVSTGLPLLTKGVPGRRAHPHMGRTTPPPPWDYTTRPLSPLASLAGVC